MGYVDLQRRVERTGQKRERGSRRAIAPYLSVAAGFALGVLASTVVVLAASDGYASLSGFRGPIPLLFAVVSLRRRTAEVRPGFGAKKQLLLAIRDAGGVTPVEAALRTSLTVDEAEDTLTRFADRGHLRVESRDSVLSYALPDERTTT